MTVSLRIKNIKEQLNELYKVAKNFSTKNNYLSCDTVFVRMFITFPYLT